MKPDRRYKVRPGDTLSQIAERYLRNGSRPAWVALAHYNGLPDPDLIFPGQVLLIPHTVSELYRRTESGELHLPSPAPEWHNNPAALAAPAPAPESIQLFLPADGLITSDYGPREAIPSLGMSAHFHPGIDIWWPGCGGAPFLSPISGSVLHVGDNGNGYGVHVILEGASLRILVAHLRSSALRAGARCGAGEHLGLVGSSGASTGDHIHLEAQNTSAGAGWIYGASIDPTDRIEIRRI